MPQRNLNERNIFHVDGPKSFFHSRHNSDPVISDRPQLLQRCRLDQPGLVHGEDALPVVLLDPAGHESRGQGHQGRGVAGHPLLLEDGNDLAWGGMC